MIQKTGCSMQGKQYVKRKLGLLEKILFHATVKNV